MAEGALRACIAGSPLAHWVEVDSAGTGDWHVGQPPDPRAIACARGHGVDIAGLRARQLRAADFARFDWVLCADASNVDDVLRIAPADAQDKVALLMEWSGLQAYGSIPDPYTGGADEFEQVWQLVDRAAQAVVDRLAASGESGIIGHR